MSLQEIQNIKKDNRQLKAVLQRYRNMLQETHNMLNLSGTNNEYINNTGTTYEKPKTDDTFLLEKI